MSLFIEYLQKDPSFYLAVVITVIISVTLHELAHGWTAVWMGDRTPIEMDRLTPNPLVHMGTMSLIFTLVAGLGWGAMPVNPSRMRGKYADAIVSLAGPAMNLLLASIAILIWGLWGRFDHSAGTEGTISNTIFYLARIFGIWNIALATFNMIPIPPLDGSRILADVLPAYREWAYSPTMMGVWQAVFIACFFFAGRFLWPFAFNVTEAFHHFVRGH